MNYQPVVEDGAKLLDQKRPGWANEINTETLEMHDFYSCILGQLYGHYFTGIDLLKIQIKGDAWGFNVRGFNVHRNPSLYQALQSAWLVEIKMRRTA